MKSKKCKWTVSLLSFLPVILPILLYSKLPEKIPTHWGFDGQVTLGDKKDIWVFVLMSLVFGILFQKLPNFDPKKKNYEKFSKYYDGFSVLMILFLFLAYLVLLSESFFPGKIPVGKAVSVSLGVLLIYVGNMLPKLKSNFFMGFKNPWTLSSEEIWYKTHR